MIEFPKYIDNLIYEIAKEFNMEVAKETHYDAINRVIFWFEGKIRKRIDFTLIDEIVDVTFYKDTFPFCPKFLIWCYNAIPMFPLYAKGEWKALDKLPLEKTDEFYRTKIASYIEYSMRKDKHESTGIAP